MRRAHCPSLLLQNWPLAPSFLGRIVVLPLTLGGHGIQRPREPSQSDKALIVRHCTPRTTGKRLLHGEIRAVGVFMCLECPAMAK